MIDELERLRDCNPVPADVTPGPIEDLLARIEAESPAPTRGYWVGRVAGSLIPILAVGTALAVAAVAIVVLSHRRSAGAPASHTSGRPPIPLPKRGMPGMVVVTGATLMPNGVDTISLQQCFPCAGGTRAGQRNHTWRLTSTNGGRSWAPRRMTWLDLAQFSGPADGWAIGYAQPPASGPDQAYVTHDGGRTWSPVRSPGGLPIADISVAGGTVWAIAARVEGGHCPTAGACVAVLRGSAAGSSLSPAASQPVAGAVAPSLDAGSADTAYLDVAHGSNRVAHLVTRDGGRTWETLPRFCPVEGADRTLTVDSATSLWRFCWSGTAPVLLGRSTDGGRTYRRYHVPAPGTRGAPERFEAVSGQVAWEMTDHGDIIRITNGGARSAVVWRQSNSQDTTVNGIPEALTVHDADTAYVTVVVGPDRRADTTGSYIVIYATHDGGRTWTTQEVVPPTG
jgi:photosystem II stability/assembly factor-like uncharacterized protein